MRPHRMTPYPDADPSIHTIVGGDALEMISARVPGLDSFTCGHCGELICSNVNHRQLIGFVYVCPGCQGFCIMPPGFDVATAEKGPAPPPKVVGLAYESPVAGVFATLDAAIDWLKKIGLRV